MIKHSLCVDYESEKLTYFSYWQSSYFYQTCSSHT